MSRTATSRIDVAATEYRWLPLVVDPIDGIDVVLDASAIRWNITGPGHAGTLHPIDRLVVDGQVHYAGLLIGPAGGLALVAGLYRVHGVIVDAPETVHPLPVQQLAVIEAE